MFIEGGGGAPSNTGTVKRDATGEEETAA